jgi:hypothetical protein
LSGAARTQQTMLNNGPVGGADVKLADRLGVDVRTVRREIERVRSTSLNGFDYMARSGEESWRHAELPAQARAPYPSNAYLSSSSASPASKETSPPGPPTRTSTFAASSGGSSALETPTQRVSLP